MKYRVTVRWETSKVGFINVESESVYFACQDVNEQIRNGSFDFGDCYDIEDEGELRELRAVGAEEIK